MPANAVTDTHIYTVRVRVNAVWTTLGCFSRAQVDSMLNMWFELYGRGNVGYRA